MRKSDDKTLIAALRILVRDIQSDDGVANACIAEATNRLEELTQWQPIDSAPKDETDIIIFCPYIGVTTAKFYDRKWICTANGGEKAVSYMDYSTTEYHDDIKPTHWMQLPNSPK